MLEQLVYVQVEKRKKLLHRPEDIFHPKLLDFLLKRVSILQKYPEVSTHLQGSPGLECGSVVVTSHCSLCSQLTVFP